MSPSRSRSVAVCEWKLFMADPRESIVGRPGGRRELTQEAIRGNETPLRYMASTLVPRTRDTVRRDPFRDFGLTPISLHGLRNGFRLSAEETFRVRSWNPTPERSLEDISPGSLFAVSGTFTVDTSNQVTVTVKNGEANSTHFLVGGAHSALADDLKELAGIQVGLVVATGKRVWASDTPQDAYYASLADVAVVPPININDTVLARVPESTKVGISAGAVIDGDDLLLVSGGTKKRRTTWPATQPPLYEDGDPVSPRDRVNGTGTIGKKWGRPVVVLPERFVKVEEREYGPVRDYMTEYLLFLSQVSSENNETNSQARRAFAGLWHKALELVDPDQRDEALQALRTSIDQFAPSQQPFMIDPYDLDVQRDSLLFTQGTGRFVEEHTGIEFLQGAQDVLAGIYSLDPHLRVATLNLVDHYFGPEYAAAILGNSAMVIMDRINNATDPTIRRQEINLLQKTIANIYQNRDPQRTALLFTIADNLSQMEGDDLRRSFIKTIDVLFTIVGNDPDEQPSTVAALERFSYTQESTDPEGELRRKQHVLAIWRNWLRGESYQEQMRIHGIDMLLARINDRIVWGNLRREAPRQPASGGAVYAPDGDTEDLSESRSEQAPPLPKRVSPRHVPEDQAQPGQRGAESLDPEQVRATLSSLFDGIRRGEGEELGGSPNE
jgi:hypothetical protein